MTSLNSHALHYVFVKMQIRFQLYLAPLWYLMLHLQFLCPTFIENESGKISSNWFKLTYIMANETSFFCFVQVNLFQKPSFLYQLTHNMTRDCSLNYKKKNSSEDVVYKNCFFYFDIQNNICTQHVLNLHFSCNSMNNLSSNCGFVESRMRISDTDLPEARVQRVHASVDL